MILVKFFFKISHIIIGQTNHTNHRKKLFTENILCSINIALIALKSYLPDYISAVEIRINSVA